MKNSSHLYQRFSFFTHVVLLFSIFCCTPNSDVYARKRRRPHARYHLTRAKPKNSQLALPVTTFSRSYSLFLPSPVTPKTIPSQVTVNENSINPYLVWEKTNIEPFSEFIFSWNIVRPKTGKYSFWVNIKHNYWSGWQKFAEWGSRGQKTFSCANDPYVHVKYVRIELQKGRRATGFQVKIIAEKGAELGQIKACFANTTNLDQFKIYHPSRTLPSTLVQNVPKQSQWKLDHERTKDLCSPTSISMVTNYFKNILGLQPHEKSLLQDASIFADKAHDDGFDIYGNWILNVAQAFNSTRGAVFYRVERLNSFADLHTYLKQKIPVAVSVRGWMHGCAWPYNNGHFIVVVGWDEKKRNVLCIDPAFRHKKLLARAYPIRDFLNAWSKSRNLSYIPIPQTSPTNNSPSIAINAHAIIAVGVPVTV